ncbi:MAG TPA: 3-oxoacyl-ACP synthase III family protein [Candidatus Limnocylindrales bacterium]|nr:3-oxoacyl-ACP synthase III family protein [Candidatus Limnocylindrales bacterium]
MHAVALRDLEAELPGTPVSDAELARELRIEESEVARWSGGRARHESGEGEGPAALLARATQRLLERRGLATGEIDFLVAATNTPDMFFPGTGCVLQSLLEAPPIGALDVRANCTGFLVALDVGSRFVASGRYRRVLVAAADTPSHFNGRNGRTPELACAMGDSACAVLLERAETASEVLAVRVHTDGSRATDYWCEYPASRHREGSAIRGRNRLPADKVAQGLHLPRVNLEALRELALARVPAVFDEALQQAGVAAVDATLIAHLLPDVEEELATRLGARAGSIVRSTLAYSGGASLAVLLAHARSDGRVQAGQTVALATSGAGASWGAAVIRCS